MHLPAEVGYFLSLLRQGAIWVQVTRDREWVRCRVEGDIPQVGVGEALETMMRMPHPHHQDVARRPRRDHKEAVHLVVQADCTACGAPS